MKVLLTTKNFKFPPLAIVDISNRQLKFSKRRILTTGKKFLVKDLELMLGETQPSDIKFSTNPNVLLIKDFLRNPKFFVGRIFKTWQIEIFGIDDSSLPIKFRIGTSRLDLVWVSRQAALAGVRPSDLGVSLELDYLRSPGKFEIMIRYVLNENHISYEMYDRKELKLVAIENSNSPCLGYRTFENVDVVSGRLVTKSDQIIPVSNYRNEVTVHRAGYLASAGGTDSYFALRTHKDLQALETAVFFGYSDSWFHFLIECLPRLISIPNKLREGISVILPSQSPKQIRSICELLTKTKTIEVDLLERIKVRQIVLGIETGVIDPLEFTFREAAIKQAVTEIRRSVLIDDVDETNEKIYLRRPKGLFRPLQNEKRLISQITKMGFKVISPEEMEFHEVLKCMTDARIIVGESGAALTNVLFTLPGAKVVELYPGKGPLTFWPELAAMADAKVEKVMTYRCPIGPRGIARDGIYVPLRKLKKLLKRWMIHDNGSSY